MSFVVNVLGKSRTRRLFFGAGGWVAPLLAAVTRLAA